MIVERVGGIEKTVGTFGYLKQDGSCGHLRFIVDEKILCILFSGTPIFWAIDQHVR